MRLSAGSPEAVKVWYQGQLSRFSGIGDTVKSVFDQMGCGTTDFNAPANTRLRNLSDKNNQLGLVRWSKVYAHPVKNKWDLTGDEIKRLAGQRSLHCVSIVGGGEHVRFYLEEYFSACDLSGSLPKKGYLLRVQSTTWWRNLLNRECKRRTEQSLRCLGLVSRHGGLYVSNYTFAGWVEQQRRAALMLQDATLTDTSTGESISLADAAGSSVSDLEKRRAELMTRISGCESVATKAGLKPIFLTLTCPSKFHVFSGSTLNENYQGLTPRDGSDYLNDNWKKIRAKLQRDGIPLYGLRIAEPHHDGCPHWHVLLFVDPSFKRQLLEVVRHYSLLEDGNEPGALKHRVRIEELNQENGAAGYVAKYVSKNVDGFAVDEDSEAPGMLSKDTALRVRAWASTWGIRQFQFVGNPSVTVWRELRRLAADENNPDCVQGDAVEVMESADSGDWSEFTNLMGGHCAKRKETPIRPHYSTFTPVSGVQRVGAYDEVVKAIAGVMTASGVVISRWREWVLILGRSRAPWPCVNNCMV